MKKIYVCIGTKFPSIFHLLGIQENNAILGSESKQRHVPENALMN